MSLWSMAWKYLWRRPLVTLLTLISIALGAALIASVLTLRRETRKSFDGANQAFDMVVGAKGSPLQLVLSTIYHMDMPTGNIPYSRYQKLQNDSRVRYAVPIGLGDNYQGFRIIGTETNLFSALTRPKEKREARPVVELAQGALFAAPFEAVIGEFVAQQSGLTLGDEFYGTHGLINLEGSEEHEDFPFTVVGILKHSNTPNDRAIFTPMESIWEVHDFEEEQHNFLFGGTSSDEEEEDDADDDPREVTAVLIQLKAAGQRLWMAQQIQKDTESMAAIPINEMHRLYRKVLGPMQTSLLTLAYLVVTVSALTILTTLYQSAERRRRDLAVMRALGGRRSEMFILLVLEALLLTTIGIGAGWLLGHGAVQIAAVHFRESMGLSIRAWTVDRFELISLLVIAGIGLLAGVIPAALAYRSSPVKDLARV
jgi:putative ABC transport system permease protein